jgi:hypothetical protein
MRTHTLPVVSVVATLVAVAGVAAPAFAHEEINPKTFPTGQPTFFTLSAANEETANLVKIVLHAPAGLAFGSTNRTPTGWSVTRTDDTVTWTGGAVKPDTFDTWGYEIEGADQPGTLAYKITLSFADGKSDDVEVDVNAVAPAATGAGGAPGAAATTVTTGATSPTTEDDEAAGGGRSDSGSGTAKAALAVAIAALLVAAGALAVGSRRRGPGATGGGGGAGAAQDW